MNDRTHDDHPDSTRRRLLRTGAAARGAIPGTGQLAARAQGAFDWKRFKGEKIEVFHVKSPRGDLLTKHHKEFEDLTGITVGSESIPEQQQRQKAAIEFNSGNMINGADPATEMIRATVEFQPILDKSEKA